MHTNDSSRIIKDINAFRFYSLALAIFIYAITGSPTPDQPGLTEIIVGILLLCAAGPGVLRRAFMWDTRRPLWHRAGQVFLVYGLSAGLLTGLAVGNGLSLIIRDILPFLFLFMPLLMADIFDQKLSFVFPFTVLFALSGVVFALRAAGWMYVNFLPMPGKSESLFYLANAPSVLFAALWLWGASAWAFIDRPASKRFLIMIGGIILSMIAVAAMSASMQRAGIGSVFIYGLILFAFALWRFPYRAMAVLIPVIVCAALFSDILGREFETLMQKTVQYGGNMRVQEAAAVWRTITDDPLQFIFGMGWGGTFESPAVAGIRVNYTHSLLTAMMLKTGITGFILVVVYIAAIGKVLMYGISKNPVLGFALTAPFLIDVFFYAAYKSVDFGFLLLLVAVFQNSHNSFLSRRSGVSEE